VEKIAVLAVGVVDHTDSELQEGVAVELGRLGERTAVQIPQLPEADKGCTVASQGAAVAVAVAETAPVVHVAVAAAVVAAAVAASGSFVNHHSHNWHTKQTAQAEDAVVRAPVLGQVQTAIEDCTSAVVEAELLLPL
jgi:hypothetical protein